MTALGHFPSQVEEICGDCQVRYESRVLSSGYSISLTKYTEGKPHWLSSAVNLGIGIKAGACELRMNHLYCLMEQGREENKWRISKISFMPVHGQAK